MAKKAASERIEYWHGQYPEDSFDQLMQRIPVSVDVESHGRFVYQDALKTARTIGVVGGLFGVVGWGALVVWFFQWVRGVNVEIKNTGTMFGFNFGDNSPITIRDVKLNEQASSIVNGENIITPLRALALNQVIEWLPLSSVPEANKKEIVELSLAIKEETQKSKPDNARVRSSLEFLVRALEAGKPYAKSIGEAIGVLRGAIG